MTTLSPALRKAAVLVSALDEAAAEALLDQMGAEQAAKIRSALVALDDIPAAEQQQVLAEFLKHQAAPAATAASHSDDVALDIDPALEAAVSDAKFSVPLPVSTPPDSPWAFLHDVHPRELATLLRREHPQMVAAVVGQLPAEHAAAVLEILPANLATDALERMASLHELSPEVSADLARELRQQLAPHGRSSRSGQVSLGHLTAVLGAMDFRQRQRVILQLADRNASLLGELGLSTPANVLAAKGQNSVVAFRYRLENQAHAHARHTRTANNIDTPVMLLEFNDLAQLSDAALRAIFAAAHPEVVLLALTAAEDALVNRLMRQLPPAERAVLRGRLEQPGPIRLREIERAQHELVAIASRLAHTGTIELPPEFRFAAAV